MSSNQVGEVIHSLNNSSPGHDELSPLVAKACMYEFVEPKEWYPFLSLVIPAFSLTIGPYLCCTLKKNLEKIVCNLVFDLLSDNEIFDDCQFGFQPKHSTQHALITLVDRHLLL